MKPTKIIDTTSYNVIPLTVNNHTIKLTTDQEITEPYLIEIVAHIKKLEAKQPPRVILTNIRGE